MRRVAETLEAIHLEAEERVDRAELVDDEDPAAGLRDAGELRDRELGPADVVEDAVAADEVELARSRTAAPSTSPSTKRTFSGAAARAASR